MVPVKKLLFPTDFSANATHALRHAIQLAGFSEGEIVVQHVVSDYFEQHKHWATLFDVHELQKHMDGYVATEVAKALPTDADGIRVRQVISKGKPADEIAALAEREMVDVVVMGSARGVTTNKVMRLTSRPVLAVSTDTTSSDDSHVSKVERILVATDFSEHSKRVVQYAFELKRAFGATIYLMYVIEPRKAIEFGINQDHYFDATEKMREWAMNQLINLTPDEFVNGPRVVRIVENGSPSERIAEVAQQIRADLTVLGTHEHSVLHQHVLGTTADRLLATISNPVLTLKI
jgi:nucleotide-binding universal stress UspA family protein